LIDTDKDGLQGDHEVEPGIAGVVLNITGPDKKPVTDVFGNTVGPVTTDGEGNYLFENLPVLEEGESYTVAIDREASAEALKGLEPTIEVDGDRENDSSTWTATTEGLTEDGQEDLTLDFGFFKPEEPVEPAKTYAIGDYVWIDTDENGQQDSGEEPLANVTVNLLDAAGNPVPGQTTTTDANGYYQFDEL